MGESNTQPASPNASSAGAAASPASSTGGYVFTSFRGDGDGLHLSYSTDGLEWTDLRKSFLAPTVGSKLFRDPNITRGPDGTYHLVWTSGWHDRGFGYATSRNLIDWSPQQFLPLMEHVTGTQTCWSPESFWDDATNQFIVTWSSNVPHDGKDRHRAYYVTTRDFKTFSAPAELFDPGFDNIHTTLVRIGERYAAVFKETDDQSAKRYGGIWAAYADKPTGPYTTEAKPMVAGLQIEGPALLQLGDTTLLYADFYANQRYGVWATRDWHTWHDVTDTTAIVDGQRQGSILSVPADVLNGLRAGEAALIASVPAAILDGFTADPAIRVFGDTFYVYPTSDKPHWMTTDFSVWSSKNLVDWTAHGMILDVAHDLKWAHSRAWAPDCMERNGKYYFYFCGDGRIGVAVSDKPTGPFKDALGHPLVQKGGKVNVYTIDPSVFVDDDGQAYLFFGNGRCAQVFKLNDDMISFKGDPTDVFLKEFREAVWVVKRGGKYHFTWSIDDARSPDYRVGYGTSNSPLGPVTPAPEHFIVLHQHGNAVGTAHHSIVNVPGTDHWYCAYHRHAVPGGSGYKRQTCLVRMTFDEHGYIRPMDPLQPAFPPGSPGETVAKS